MQGRPAACGDLTPQAAKPLEGELVATLEAMRADFREGLGDRAEDYTTAEVDAALNRVWQYGLPQKVPDLFGPEKVTGITTTASDENLDLSDASLRIRQILRPLYVNGTEVSLWQYAHQFWGLYDIDDTTEAPPADALFVSPTKLILRQIPDSAYPVIVTALRYNAALDAAGLGNEAMADATVRGAIVREAAQRGHDEILQRFAALFGESLSQLRGEAAGIPRDRLVVADF